MSESRFVAVMDAIDWYGNAQREAHEKQRMQFTLRGLTRAAGASGEDGTDWTISPARAGYAAFLASLQASGFALVRAEPPTPREAE